MKRKEESTVDVKDVTMESPTVEIGEMEKEYDSLLLSIGPVQYSIKKLLLPVLSLRLKNAGIAYRGDILYKIDRCIDYFYNIDPGSGGGIKKAIASARASFFSCVILSDKDEKFLVCSLDRNIWFPEVCTFDDYSSPYGGLTCLETRGKKDVNGLKIVNIVTSERMILEPKENQNDFIPGNSNYYLDKKRQTVDMATFLVYITKMGPLEKNVTGIHYKGEENGGK